jgi:hypothetical protein
VKNGFSVVLLVAGLAGCGATPTEYRNDKEMPLPPGQGMFGETTTWEWRRKDTVPSAQPAVAPTSAAPAQSSAGSAEDFKKWRESAGSADRKEFEDWRAWQEWKRRNP